MERREFVRVMSALGAGMPAAVACATSGSVPRAATAAAPVRPRPLQVAPYYLPDWYDANRAQAHLRLSLEWLDRPVFSSAASDVRSLGARVLTRHIKSGDEGAWWPSSVGIEAPECRGRDVARAIIDRAHEAGCRIIVYYRHEEDAYAAEQHPGWLCRDWRGRAIATNRGRYLCMNSPYREFVGTRLRELEAMGADGFFFDEAHMPPIGCWCDYCRRAFRAEYGMDLAGARDLGDPRYETQLTFNNRTVERTFAAWRERLHGSDPDLVMVVSAYRWVTAVGRHLDSRLMAISDSVKTEFALPAVLPGHSPFALSDRFRTWERDVQLGMGYTMARDAAGGRPPLVWIQGRLSRAALSTAAAAVLTHGGVASIDIAEAMPTNPVFAAPFALWDRVAPYLGGARPLRWAAIHFPEWQRDRLATDPAQAWERVLTPFYAAFRLLLRARVPVGMVTDDQLEKGLLDGYAVLVEPDSQSSTSAMRTVFEAFAGNGGRVVARSRTWLDDLHALVEEAPVRALGGPERMHAVPHVQADSGTTAVALVNDFSWVRTGRQYTPARGWVPPPDPSPVPDASSVRVRFRGRAVPSTALEAVSGSSLPVRSVEGGWEVEVPSFDPMAVVVVPES